MELTGLLERMKLEHLAAQIASSLAKPVAATTPGRVPLTEPVL
jgi:hypothetical protein